MSRSLAGVPVLVLGTGVTLLGVLRVLGEAGADLKALPDVDPLARRSRYYRSASPQLAGLTPDALIEGLESVPIRSVLLACSDAWVSAVARLPPALREQYPSCLAPVAAMETLVDKARFAAVLEQLQLPHPLTRALTGVDALTAVPDSALPGAFLKPADSQRFYARFAVKAFHVSGRAEAEARVRECAALGLELVLQEYIPGPPTHHYFIDGFVDRGGTIRALFARQRLRMYPPDFGNSTLMKSVTIGEAADGARTLETLLAHLRYRGIFSAEFKRDQRDGRWKILEVNARPWWYVEYAARCGVDVCSMAVRDALGQPVETVSSYAVGRSCVYPYFDFPAARDAWRSGRLSLAGWAASWLLSEHTVFRWSDPGPALGELRAFMRRRFS